MSTAETRLDLVLDLARDVTARRDLDDLLAATFPRLRRLVGFTGGSIQLLDEDGWIRMAATYPAAPAHVLAMRIPLGTTVGGRIILTERPVYVPDVIATVPPERRRANLSRGVRSYYGVPLLAEGRAIGLLQIDAEEPEAWNEEDRLIVASIAPVVAAAIQNARAHAVRDAALRREGDAVAWRETLSIRWETDCRPLLAELCGMLGAESGVDSGTSSAPARLRMAAAQADRLRAMLDAFAAALDPTRPCPVRPETVEKPEPAETVSPETVADEPWPSPARLHDASRRAAG